MAEEENFFLACLRFFLKETGSSERIQRCLKTSTINWDLILYWSHWHGVTPLLYHVLNELNWITIPKQVREKLEKSFRVNIARNLFLSSEIERVLERLNKKGVVSIPLKGVYLSEEVYPDISFRMVTDIDLLIRGEDLLIAEKSLLEIGYGRDHIIKKAFSPDNCYTLHMEKGEENGQRLCVELHWGLANRRDYRLPLKNWWEQIFQNVQARYSRNGIRYLIMGPEITLLYLTINAHMSRYSFLKQLVDIAQVIRYYEQEINWENLINTAQALNLLDNLIFALMLVHKMFGVQTEKKLPHQLTPWKQRILQSLFTEQRLIRGKMGQDLRQFLLLFLLDEKAIIKSILKVCFSSPSTVAYRYSLSPQSHSTYLYVFLNPILSIYRLLRGSVVDCWTGKGIGGG